jgi:hypothetical protein
MKKFQILKTCSHWSTSRLTRDVEELLAKAHEEGYEIISVSFGVNMWWMPTAYVTIAK